MFRPEQNRFLIGSFDFDAVCFYSGIVLECVMYDAALIRIEWFHLDDVTPTTNFLRCFLRFLDKPITLLRAIIADIERNFWTFRIFFENQTVRDVLQLAQRLALTANQAPGIGRLDIEGNLAIDIAPTHCGAFKSECLEELFGIAFGSAAINRSFLFGRRRGRLDRPTGLPGRTGLRLLRSRARDFHLRNR